MKRHNRLFKLLLTLLIGGLSSCGYVMTRSETQSSSSSYEESTTVIEKGTPEVKITANGIVLSLYGDHWVYGTANGSVFAYEDVPVFSYVTEPAALSASCRYIDSKNNEYKTLPKKADTYRFRVKTDLTDKYESVTEYVRFTLVDTEEHKVEPVITFYCNGLPVDIAGNGNHWVGGSYAQSQYRYAQLPNITFSISPSIARGEMTIYINDRFVDTIPNEDGTAIIKVEVAEGETYSAVDEYVMLEVISTNTKDTPTITFYLDGEPVDIAGHGNHWVTGLSETSTYPYNEIPNITWAINPADAGGTFKRTINGEVITSVPNRDAIIVYKVTVPESSYYYSVEEYVMINIRAVA